MLIMVLTSTLPIPSGLITSPIARSSHLQSVVALLAEFIALTNAVHQAVYMFKLYNMLNLPLDNPMAVNFNNQSMLKIIANPLHISFIKEVFIYNNIRSGQVNIIYMPTSLSQLQGCVGVQL